MIILLALSQTVTWLTNHHPLVLWHCWLGHLTHKIVSEMTYNVSSGTLNLTIPIHTTNCHTCWTCSPALRVLCILSGIQDLTYSLGYSWCCWYLLFHWCYVCCVLSYICFKLLHDCCCANNIMCHSVSHLRNVLKFNIAQWCLFSL